MRANRAALEARAERAKRLRILVLSALAEAFRRKAKGDKPDKPATVHGADGFPLDMDEEVKAMLTDMGLTRDGMDEFVRKNVAEPRPEPRPERPMGEDGFPLDMAEDVKARLRALGYKPGQREQFMMVDGDAPTEQLKEIIETLKAAGATFNAQVIRVGDDGTPLDSDQLPADMPEAFRDVMREAVMKANLAGVSVTNLASPNEPNDADGFPASMPPELRTLMKEVGARVTERRQQEGAAGTAPGDPMDNATWLVLIHEQGPDLDADPVPVMVTVRASEGLANEVHATLTRMQAPESAHRGHGLIDLRQAGGPRRHGHEVDQDCMGCVLEAIFTRVLTEGEVVARRVVEMTPDGAGVMAPRAGTPQQPVH